MKHIEWKTVLLVKNISVCHKNKLIQWVYNHVETKWVFDNEMLFGYKYEK